MAIVNSRAAIEPKTGKAAIFVNETIHSLMRKLFSNGEQGFFYDPNDLSTMYHAAAGTIPVTASGQPVGLMLDKSKGLVLGSELVTNGDFSNGTTGWTASNVTQSIVSGQLFLTATGSNTQVSYQTLNTEIGKFYIVSCYATSSANNVTKNAARMRIMTASPVVSMVKSDGLKQKIQLIFMATSTTTNLELSVASFWAWGAVGDSAYFDDVTCHKLDGNHAYQNDSARRPILRDAPRRIDFDAVDDKLITSLPAQLTGCTVVRSVPNVGTQILTGQTIPATYSDNTDHCGLIVVNRALTPSETSAITTEFNKRAGV